MKKVFCVIVVIGFLFIGSLSVTAETYTIGMLPDIGWSYYKVAEVKGLWEKQGVSVKLVGYNVPLELMRTIFQRRVDFIPGPLAGSVTFRDAGMFDAVYVGTFSMADHHKYLMLKNDLVNKSLKGQTIGIFNADHANLFFLSSYLHTVSTTLADVRLVEMSPKDLEANFIHNRVQAVLGINLSNMFIEKANGVIAISTQEFYEPHGLAIVKKGGVTAIPPDDLKKIMRGCVEAIEWMRDPANWEEYKTILKEYYLPSDSPEFSDEQFRALTQDHKFVDPQTLLEHNQQLLRDYFTRYRAFLVSQGSVKEEVLNAFTYDNVVYNQALIEVLQEYGQ